MASPDPWHPPCRPDRSSPAASDHQLRESATEYEQFSVTMVTNISSLDDEDDNHNLITFLVLFYSHYSLVVFQNEKWE